VGSGRRARSLSASPDRPVVRGRSPLAARPLVPPSPGPRSCRGARERVPPGSRPPLRARPVPPARFGARARVSAAPRPACGPLSTSGPCRVARERPPPVAGPPLRPPATSPARPGLRALSASPAGPGLRGRPLTGARPVFRPPSALRPCPAERGRPPPVSAPSRRPPSVVRPRAALAVRPRCALDGRPAPSFRRGPAAVRFPLACRAALEPPLGARAAGCSPRRSGVFPVTLSPPPSTSYGRAVRTPRATTRDEGRLLIGGGPHRRCPAASYSPTRSPAQYHRR
jgi:hypothetical protein